MVCLYILIISALVYNTHQTRASSGMNYGKNFIYDTYKYDNMITVLVNSTTEQILDFYEDSNATRGFPTRVHVSSNDTINGDYPLFITATQQKGVLSWEIPLVIQTKHSVMQFNNMARTLCPHDAGPNITSENRPTIQLTTSNPKNVSVDIKLRRVEDFYVEVDKEVNLTVTPSTPKYYYFSFDHYPLNVTTGKGFLPRFNYTIPKNVILIIESDDDVCAVVSIQNNSVSRRNFYLFIYLYTIKQTQGTYAKPATGRHPRGCAPSMWPHSPPAETGVAREWDAAGGIAPPDICDMFCVTGFVGLALMMEGILSACYHLCPNKMNFQFDSSFMYVIAVLCMVKIYQNRHPDVNASAHSTFMLLAFIMALGVYGIMYPSVYFWVFFTILHLATCLILTLKIYYVGRFRLERSIPVRAMSALRVHGRGALIPNYKARAVLLAIANLANWALAAYGLYHHNKDFARHLLAILMGNTILYTAFYVCMKLVYRESLRVQGWLYLVLAHAAWFIALKFFLDSNTKWSETPAMSRRHNRECTVLQLMDSHDLWHICSAAALFLSFNMLLGLDNDIASHPREKIRVF
ncbi:SID1 transmembrane family member 1-like [Pectinophora gossypiella]|uniref:SID1 transmembrane family member 1-like n=1 Tax=Pectinophora gossypiella TaxID=13191 RepID=UPI00214E27DB|nr:SID1 transmembrane family member 1-like [Pectinophora gossypiella]